MLPRTSQSLFLALTAALLIILGTFGIFAAEASSFQTIVARRQTYGAVMPIDANDPSIVDSDMATIPGLRTEGQSIAPSSYQATLRSRRYGWPAEIVPIRYAR